MPILNFHEYQPKYGANLFLAPDAWLIGQTELSDDVSVFFGAVLRGDINKIIIGSRSNIQEHCVLHTSEDLGDVIVGDDVTVGHKAILHGCKVSDRCIIGMNSVLLDGAEIGQDSIVGANSLIPKGRQFPPGSLIFGSPAKLIRQLSDEEKSSILDAGRRYQEKAQWYRGCFGAELPG